MAFNFNWSPLIADTVHAREMLTTALNKSPKPPIIVDDIIVTELNLGELPPDLEILEIGDLADDRFRGIFKMSYAGDAFLTLKTKVQANPLNTYLSTRPSFASPQPLAAASGLTIPLQITLSDFRLSGFVILVFSKQKGLTIVFRNDPLESLKVSSTFDSIPFVRDYLQKVIEEQLRVLFMEDLPAILHRLSLRLWSPDYCDPSDPILPQKEDDTVPIDPLASPPREPVDWLETAFGDDSVPSISLETSTEPTTFSQKNLKALSTFPDTQRTLNISTPAVKEALFRAWAIGCDRSSGIQTPLRPGLSRASSAYGSEASSYSMASGTGSELSRPPLSRASSYSYSRTPGRQRKAKRRVVDLRRTKTCGNAQDDDPVTNSSTPEPTIAPSSAPSVMLESIIEEGASTLMGVQSEPDMTRDMPSIETVRASSSKPRQPESITGESEAPPAYTPPEVETVDFASSKLNFTEKPRRPLHLKTASTGSIPLLRSFFADRLPLSPEGSTGGILEQAWLRKMASEITRRVDEERARAEAAPAKGKEARHHEHEELEAPPAYVS